MFNNVINKIMQISKILNILQVINYNWILVKIKYLKKYVKDHLVPRLKVNN